MVRRRLLNCDFLNASAFKLKLSNKAKLLYLLMFANADDQGFVDKTFELIQSLEETDKTFGGEQVSLTLLENDYKSALNELLDRGLLFEFKDNHDNRVHLIRHWLYHTTLPRKPWTNHYGLLKLVELQDGKYVLKKESSKEKTTLSNSIVMYSKVLDSKDKEWNEIFDEIDNAKGTTDNGEDN